MSAPTGRTPGPFMSQSPDREAPAELPPPTAQHTELVAGAEPAPPAPLEPSPAEVPFAPAPVEATFAPAPVEALVAPASRRRWLRRLRPEMRARDLAVFLRGAVLLT